MTRQAAALLLATSLGAVPVRAAELPGAPTATEAPLAVYGRERMAVRIVHPADRYPAVYKGERELPIGRLGGGMSAVFPDGTPGSDEAKQARRAMVRGLSMKLAALVGFCGLLAVESGVAEPYVEPTGGPKVTVALMLLTVTYLIGAGEQSSGDWLLAEAVEAHNRALLARLQQQAAGQDGKGVIFH